MDSINFLGKADFPNSSQTMDMLQGIAKLAGSLAWLGGSNYILTGCAENAGVVSDGVVVIAGEPYKFVGGPKKAKITIQETKETLSAFGVEYPEARTKRMVTFSDAGEYVWANFEQVPTNFDLKTLFQSIKGDAPGTVKMWAGQVSKIPEGYMLCNGDELSKDIYSELFDVLGTAFGGNGISSFKLPDLRGRFIVGYDNSANSDYNGIGNTGGEDKVTLTVEEMPEHDHNISFTEEKWGDNANSRPFPSASGTASYSAVTKPAGGGKSHENRPRYFTLAYIIKVTA